jgi:hypothetical protein
MRRSVKIKAVSTRVPLRKAALSATASARRSFPAWIDANESGVAFSATVVTPTPRIRDGLVLRAVAKKKPAKPEGSTDGHGAR